MHDISEFQGAAYAIQEYANEDLIKSVLFASKLRFDDFRNIYNFLDLRVDVQSDGSFGWHSRVSDIQNFVVHFSCGPWCPDPQTPQLQPFDCQMETFTMIAEFMDSDKVVFKVLETSYGETSSSQNEHLGVFHLDRQRGLAAFYIDLESFHEESQRSLSDISSNPEDLRETYYRDLTAWDQRDEQVGIQRATLRWSDVLEWQRAWTTQGKYDGEVTRIMSSPGTNVFLAVQLWRPACYFETPVSRPVVWHFGSSTEGAEDCLRNQGMSAYGGCWVYVE